MTGFADMDWRVIPITPIRNGQPARFTLACEGPGAARLQLNRPAHHAIGKHTRQVELLLNGSAVAVRAAAPKAQHPRRLTTRGVVTVSQLIPVLGLEAGERWILEARIEEGTVWAHLPDVLVERMKQGRAA